VKVEEASPRRRQAAPAGTPIFVGRLADLARLEDSLETALHGDPVVVLLRGEAGLGKTQLLREFEARARERRLHVCRGRAHEDLSFPYLPFIEVLRDQLAGVPEPVLRVLGPDAERIQALVKGRSRSHGTDPDLEGRDLLGLFSSVSRATTELARIRPTLLTLDDLHWAEGSTIEQLLHLVYAVADSRRRERIPLMIVAAFRPVETEGLLSRALGRLQREEICTALELQGLGEDEVSELVASLADRAPTRELVRSVLGLTGGNPLFVQEVLHHLIAQNALQESGGYAALARELDDLELPRDVLSSIQVRARSVGDRCRELLVLCACLVEPIALPSLLALTDSDEEELLDRLEEAVEAQLLVDREDAFHFRHPLVRHVFYRMPSLTRRQRIHRQISTHLLERYGARAADHALEVGHHLIRAARVSDAEQVAEFAERAGDQSFERCAWADAARFYAAAATAAGRLEPPHRPMIARLHFRAGLSHHRNMDVGPSLEHLDSAVDLYRELEDQGELATVLVERMRVELAHGRRAFDRLADVAPLEEILEALGGDAAARRAQLAEVLSEAYWTAGQYERGEDHAKRAVEIARELGDDRLCAQGLVSLGMAQAERLRVREALPSLEEAAERSRSSGDVWVAEQPLQRLPLVLAWMGRIEEAEPLAEESCRATRTTQDWAEHSIALGALATVAVACGRFEEAERHCAEALAISGRSHYPWGALVALAPLISAHVWRGRHADAQRAIALLTEPGVVFEEVGPSIQFFARVFRELADARAIGRVPDATPAVALLSGTGEADLQTLGLFCAGVELAALRRDPELAEACYAPVAAAAERGMVLTSGWLFLLPRVLGVAAALNARWDRAQVHFEQALRTASEAGARPEYARSCLDYARMLAERRASGDDATAEELVRRAAPAFEELGMGPFADETVQLAERLRIRLRRDAASARSQPEATAAAPESAHRVLLVTDMEGFTTLLDRLGDRPVGSLLDHHNMILRACMREYRGREIQHTGDGFIASFESAGTALGCAVAMQRDLAAYNARNLDTPIRIRAGLHAGKALPVEDRLLGAAVNAAVRIASVAEPGEILISDEVRGSLDDAQLELRDRGPALLKGFAERFRLYEVVWA
jgi:class 3 adenylate cyclase